MPTPIELLTHPISLVVFAMYGALMLWEAVAPGRDLPRVPGWRIKGITYFVLFFFLSSYLPLVWDEHLAQYQILDLSALGTAGGVVSGLLVYQTGAWLYHRSLHRFEWLWRYHQTHHSAERLDTYSAFVFHPFDVAGWTALASFCLVVIVGVAPQAATVLVLILTWLSMFQHANVKTPRWLGYIIQRPESHTVHHAQGYHRKNYADLPLIDMLFGTFENPVDYERPTGLYAGASNRNRDLWLLRDVSGGWTSDMPSTPVNQQFTQEEEMRHVSS